MVEKSYRYSETFQAQSCNVECKFCKRIMSRMDYIPMVRKDNCYIKYFNKSNENFDIFYKKMTRFNFVTSYGIILKTRGKVIMIERKMPYCVQDFIFDIQKQNKNFFPILEFTKDLREKFEKERLPTLKASDKNDYNRYLFDLNYEDKFDFPHGQMYVKLRKKISANPSEQRKIMFKVAYQEFVEETGYRFSYDTNDIMNYPLCEVQFEGSNGIQYTQYYFIVENARNLKRISSFDCFSNYQMRKQITMERIFYKSKFIRIKDAIAQLKRQQRQKIDLKHFLLIDVEDWDVEKCNKYLRVY